VGDTKHIPINEDTFVEIEKFLESAQRLCIPIPKWLKKNFIDHKFKDMTRGVKNGK
jgi:hypothetical protein